MRKLSHKGIQQITQHEAFITMLYSTIQENTRFEAVNILAYWFEIAFNRELEEDDLNSELIDKIRYQLLIKGGVLKPILKETKRISLIKESFVYE
jgi:hypothetical protein